MAINAKTVAQAMYKAAQVDTKGINIFPSTTIDRIANQNKEM
jgi:hypothetical protein